MGNCIPSPNNKYSGITLYNTTDTFVYDAHKSWDRKITRKTHAELFY